MIGIVTGLLVTNVPDAFKFFAILIGIVAFALSVVRVEWGLFLLIFITYTRLSDTAINYYRMPSIVNYFIFFLLFATVLRWATFSEKPISWVRPALYMTLYGVVCFATIIFAADPGRILSASFEYVKCLFFVFMIAILVQHFFILRRVVWVLLAAGIFMGTLNIIQYVIANINNYYWGFARAPTLYMAGEFSGRWVSDSIGDLHINPLSMLILIPFAVDRILHEKKRVPRIIALYALVACGVTVILNFSRGAFIALIAIVIVLIYANPPRLLAFVGIIVLAIGLVPFTTDQYINRIATLNTFVHGSSDTTLTGDISIRDRTSELVVGWMMFREHPILGVGYNNYPVYYQSYARQLGLNHRSDQNLPFNMYIDILAETGLFGIVAFGFLIFGAMRGIWATRQAFTRANRLIEAKIVASIGAGLIGFLVAGFFIHDASIQYIWLMVGIAFAMPNLAKQELGLIHLW